MGTVSNAIAKAASDNGAIIHTNAKVDQILHQNGKVSGVSLQDGTKFAADIVISGCNPHHTFVDLIRSEGIPPNYVNHIRNADYSCGAMKINLAVDRLPNFTCFPSPTDGSAGLSHKGTIHFESSLSELHEAYRDASVGIPARRPVIEMTIPSSLDTTIAPPGKHVVQLFVQYIPYDLDPRIGSWSDPSFKEEIANRCYMVIEQYCPGFISSILYADVLSPLDLENIFGLHKGNIFHGALTLSQIAFARPVPGYSDYRTPLKGLYLCGSGSHPGGGVMGAPGRNCAHAVLDDNLPFLNVTI